VIIAGDIGGTNTRLAAFSKDSTQLELQIEEVFPSREAKGLEEIVLAFLGKHGISAEGACFGIAGPVRNNRCQATNLPWVIDGAQVAQQIGAKSVRLLNDLESLGYGVEVLRAEDFVVLNEGAAGAAGTQALIAAGTGLGEAGLVWTPAGYQPVPTEGGHTDFAPRNELEIELLRYLIGKFSRVSYERVLSGPGLRSVYEFLRDTGKYQAPPWLEEEIAAGDAAAAISKSGMKGTSEIAVKALDVFVSVYAAEAGNLALKFLSTGGIFFGGGIAPKILGKLQEPAFLESLFAKGRMSKLIQAMPVKVILNDNTPLLGAANVAMKAARAA
jgi:glucokinase